MAAQLSGDKNWEKRAKRTLDTVKKIKDKKDLATVKTEGFKYEKPDSEENMVFKHTGGSETNPIKAVVSQENNRYNLKHYVKGKHYDHLDYSTDNLDDAKEKAVNGVTRLETPIK
jgi:hypothetical protein